MLPPRTLVSSERRLDARGTWLCANGQSTILVAALGVAPAAALVGPASRPDAGAPVAVPGEAPPAGTYVVHSIDVGTGLSIFVEGTDFTLLYDAGSNDDTARAPDNRVIAYLKAVRPSSSGSTT